ncbi:hypothetical protein Pint_07958 [Pistacia integerrima]|uniref:Uncharacterized protein n=1 Tax=Pistacia integerrima TaxID=434235 RepID=A0ACC0XVP4_9ROSI|nr:hypothetical protein Pint_07958 [Pistacia integerrima]
MVEGYWNRQQASLLPSGPMLKRPRSDYDLPQSGMSSRHERHGYLSRDDDRGEHRSQYLSFPSGEASALAGARSGMGVSGGMAGIPIADGVSGRPGIIGRDMVSNGPSRDLDDRLPVETMARPDRETLPLPPDASNTLYVEGLPPDTTRREVARILFDTLALRNDNIFRPFVGYKEVRLVSKESKQRGGDPLIFVLSILQVQPLDLCVPVIRWRKMTLVLDTCDYSSLSSQAQGLVLELVAGGGLSLG